MGVSELELTPTMMRNIGHAIRTKFQSDPLEYERVVDLLEDLLEDPEGVRLRDLPGGWVGVHFADEEIVQIHLFSLTKPENPIAN